MCAVVEYINSYLCVFFFFGFVLLDRSQNIYLRLRRKVAHTNMFSHQQTKEKIQIDGYKNM